MTRDSRTLAFRITGARSRLVGARRIDYDRVREVGAPDRFVRLLAARLLSRGPSEICAQSLFVVRVVSREESPMSVTFSPSVIVEVRAAEGGEDAKSLVDEQLRIYARRALHHGL
jgi:hypothetical protein